MGFLRAAKIPLQTHGVLAARNDATRTCYRVGQARTHAVPRGLLLSTPAAEINLIAQRSTAVERWAMNHNLQRVS